MESFVGGTGGPAKQRMVELKEVFHLDKGCGGATPPGLTPTDTPTNKPYTPQPADSLRRTGRTSSPIM